MTLLARLTVAVCMGVCSLPVLAQQTASPDSSAAPPSATTPAQLPTQPSATPSTQSPQRQADAAKTPTSEEVLKQEEKQRALGIVPMFGMTSVKNAPPLSSKQKFELTARTMIDPFPFVSAGFTAGLGQATDSFAGYGQGAEGFAKRYGAALADNTDANLFSNFIYPVLFKQDPRYFRMGEGTIKRRTWWAIEGEFVARQDSGGHMFHFSNVLGAITAGTISNAYYPQADRGVGLTAGRAGTALGYGCLGDIFLEFWPDIEQKLRHKHESQAHPIEPPVISPK